MKKTVIIILSFFYLISCGVKNDKREIMLESDMVFNGKLKKYFTIQDFEKVFGKVDSARLMLEKQPCSYVFENEDGSKDLNDKYLYKDGSRFENSKDKVAVDEFRFSKNNYILYKGILLDSSKTVNDLRKIFPNAINAIKTIDVYGEGKLKVIELSEDREGISDGHVEIFFKNEKLYSLHWWYPC